MGDAGFIFTGENDHAIMHNSATINLNVLEAAYRRNCRRIFYSSSACIYPAYNQTDPDNPHCAESSAYPAAPDSEYGWEKLFSERLYIGYARNRWLMARIARYHNIFGPEGSYVGWREKVPAALCRKIADAPPGGKIEVWGDSKQTRSFLYVDGCVEGTIRLVRSDFPGPVNIGSEEMVTITRLAKMIMGIARKPLEIRYIPGPTGVRGRKSDNCLIQQKLGWAPRQSLETGVEVTYRWISQQLARQARSGARADRVARERSVLLAPLCNA
jgi:GDP-D-mannose 3', 5'-epimerase